MLPLIIRLFSNRHWGLQAEQTIPAIRSTLHSNWCAELREWNLHFFLKLSFNFSHNSFLPCVHLSPKPWFFWFFFRAQIVWKCALSALLTGIIGCDHSEQVQTHLLTSTPNPYDKRSFHATKTPNIGRCALHLSNSWNPQLAVVFVSDWLEDVHFCYSAVRQQTIFHFYSIDESLEFFWLLNSQWGPSVFEV